MRHCIEDIRQVDGHTHVAMRWFPLFEACLDVPGELEEGRCSRVSGSEAVLILSWREKFVNRGYMSASRTLTDGHMSKIAKLRDRGD